MGERDGAEEEREKGKICDPTGGRAGGSRGTGRGHHYPPLSGPGQPL